MSLLTQFYPGPGGDSSGSFTLGDFLAGGAAVSQAWMSVPGESVNLVGNNDIGKPRVVYAAPATAPVNAQPTYSCAVSGFSSKPATQINFQMVDFGGNATYSITNVLKIAGINCIYSTASVAFTLPDTTELINCFFTIGNFGSGLTITAVNLTTLTNCSFVFSQNGNSQSFNLNSCALDAASVDSVLIRLNETSINSSGGTINIAGGNAAPTAAGTAAKAALIAKNYVVTTN